MTIKVYKENGSVRFYEGVKVLYCNSRQDLYLTMYERSLPLIIQKEGYRSFEVCIND